MISNEVGGRLQKENLYLGMQDSVLFRRGQNMASSSEEFQDIANVLENLVNQLPDRISILEVGCAHGQELLSVFAVLEPLLRKKNRKMNEILDVEIVDIRPALKPEEIKATVPAFLVEELFGSQLFITESLVEDEPRYLKVKGEIVNFLITLLQQDEGKYHSYWQTNVLDYVEMPDDKRFNLILYNNTHGHITDDQRRDTVLRKLLDKLKVGGLIITDEDHRDPIAHNQNSEDLIGEYNLLLVAPGIYKRKRLVDKIISDAPPKLI